MEGASHYFMLLDFEYPKNQLCRNYLQDFILNCEEPSLTIAKYIFLRSVYIIEIYCNNINVELLYLTQLHVNA